MTIKEILALKFLGNTIADYSWLGGALLFAFIFQKYISRYLSNLIFSSFKKYIEEATKEELFNLIYKPLRLTIYLIVIYVGTSHIEFPQEWDIAPIEKFGLRMFIQRSYLFILIISITWIFLKLADFVGLVLLKKAEKTDSKQDDQIVLFLREIIKILIIGFSFFIVLGVVFKLDIGAIVAGLGVGGLALALAAKESLENLLASFTIFADKPFVVGDLVQVGSIIGTVEKVGFRSTRIRTLEKSYLTLPNKKMVDAELDNLSLRTFRRARFNIGVLYTTKEEQLLAIIKDIQDYIDNHPRTNQDGKVRFVEFGDYSLNIMIEYFVDTMDWLVYLDVKQEINLKIMEIVKKHGSDFAYPTTTVYLQPNNKQ
jgi:MscS family membrane protein